LPNIRIVAMNSGKVVGGTGAARPSREAEQGGPAPEGARIALNSPMARLIRIDDRDVPDLLKRILTQGAVVVGFNEGLPVIQIYDRQLQKYRRFTWRLVDAWYTKVVDMFEVVE
jgi:hypothetical protein